LRKLTRKGDQSNEASVTRSEKATPQRTFFMDRGSSLNTLMNSYCDYVTAHIAASRKSGKGSHFPPPIPHRSQPLGTERERRELLWYLEELPLQQESSSIHRLMQVCVLKRCPELALALFSLWCGAGWTTPASRVSRLTVLLLTTLFDGVAAESEPSVVAADFAHQDARRHLEAFPFDGTLTLRPAEGGLLGAMSHAKSPLFIGVWTVMAAQHAATVTRRLAPRHDRPPATLADSVGSMDTVLFSEFLSLVQRWWSHSLVSRDEWASLQQLLLEMAAAAVADVVVKNVPVGEVLALVESVQSGHMQSDRGQGDQVDDTESHPSRRTRGRLYRMFSGILSDVAGAVEASWVSAALHEDPRLAKWFAAERRRIGDVALLKFAQHFLFQREHQSVRHFNVAQPWVRLSTQLGFMTLSPTRPPTVADAFRRLWLLHLAQVASSFTSDSESVGRKKTVSQWMQVTSPLTVAPSSHLGNDASDDTHDQSFLAVDELNASQARNAAAAALADVGSPDGGPEEDSEVAPIQNDQNRRGAQLLLPSTLQPLPPQVAYHCDATHEAIELILWILRTHFAHQAMPSVPAVEVTTSKVRSRWLPAASLAPPTDVVTGLTPVYITALSALTLLGDDAAAEALLIDVRCPPPTNSRSTASPTQLVDGADAGGDQLDQGVGSLFVRGLGRSGNDALATALHSWWLYLLRPGSDIDAREGDGVGGAHDSEGDAISSEDPSAEDPSAEANRVIFYYWARTVSDVVAEAELYQSLLWQPLAAPVEESLSSCPRWLRFLRAACRHSTERSVSHLAAPLNISWMVRVSWDYLLTLSIARDLPPPSLIDGSSRISIEAAARPVEWLRGQALQLLLICMQDDNVDGVPHGIENVAEVDNTAAAARLADIAKSERLTSKKVSLLSCLSESMNSDDTMNSGPQPSVAELRTAVIASIRGGSESNTLTRLRLFAYVGLCRASGGNGGGSVQPTAVVERVLGTIVSLFWHDCELLRVCLPLVGSERGDATSVTPLLLVSILCRHLVLFPTPDHRALVEPFLLTHVFTQHDKISGDNTTTVAQKAHHQRLVELIAQNYYVQEVHKRLCNGEGLVAGGLQQRHKHGHMTASPHAPVLFPSLQLQDHRAVVQTLQSTKRRSVLPFSLSMWHAGRGTRAGRPEARPSAARGRASGLQRGGGSRNANRLHLTAQATSALLAPRCTISVATNDADADLPQMLASRDPLSEEGSDLSVNR
jgi:hypothetical protein